MSNLYATRDFRIDGRPTFAGEPVDPSCLPQGDAAPYVKCGWLAHVPPATWVTTAAVQKRAAHEAKERERVKSTAAAKRALAASKLAHAEALETEALALEAEAEKLDPMPRGNGEATSDGKTKGRR